MAKVEQDGASQNLQHDMLQEEHGRSMGLIDLNGSAILAHQRTTISFNSNNNCAQDARGKSVMMASRYTQLESSLLCSFFLVIFVATYSYFRYDNPLPFFCSSGPCLRQTPRWSAPSLP